MAANLRRRARQGYSTGAVSGVAVQVVEWQEVESVYEDEWTGESMTKASLYPTEMEDLESTWESRSRRR